MPGRGGGVVEVAQRDPAAHEVQVGPVVFIGRQRGGADHVIGGLELALIEQLAGERAPLAPPLIGVLQRHRLRRGRHHQAGRVIDLVLGEHPLDAAQRVAEILSCLDCDIVERLHRLVRFSPDRGTGLHDRKLVAAKTLRGALRAGEILGADAPVHARTVVIAIEQIAERLEHVDLQALRQFVRSPCIARQPRRAVPIALREQHACQRQLALGTGGLVASEAADRRRIDALLPQPRLCAPAQQRRARPFRIGGDERRVAAERRDRFRMAQDVPLDELLRRRIRDPVPDVRRLLGLCLAREIDGFLHQRKIARQRSDSDGLLGSRLRPSTASPCVVRKRVWRADFFRTQRCDGSEPPSLRCDFLVASCAFWACGLWLVRAVASVEKRASPAIVKKQDSERKHRFIPWSPCETHVTNTVRTKRSRDAWA